MRDDISAQHGNESEDWLCDQFNNITSQFFTKTPSEYAEETRYLPQSVTPKPGKYRYAVAPYLREIVDCMDVNKAVDQIAVRKGVQICATVGLLENALLYAMGYIKNAPVMMVTADDGLSKLRMESYITPMINESGLEHLIQSADSKNHRKTGKTDKKIEWHGGGWLAPCGAQNADKLRSLSIRILLNDEIDGWPDYVGKDGDPATLVLDRTAAFSATRKVLWISTPLLTHTSKIDAQYELGDQRKYMVPCRGCGEKQELRFSGTTDEGVKFGLIYNLDPTEGTLVEGSVRYACKFCSHEHVNEDKVWMLPRGEWVPTAKPSYSGFRSYDLPALYSPPGFESWELQVRKYLKAYDPVEGRVKSHKDMQTFYNNVLGRSYTPEGTRVTLETVRNFRNPGYVSGTIPNKLALHQCDSIIHILVMSIDVHDSHLDYQIVGFCKNLISYSIEYGKMEGDCSNAGRGVWLHMKHIIQNKRWVDESGRAYPVSMVLIDSRHNSDVVYSFCNQDGMIAIPIAGKQKPVKNSLVKEFSEFPTKSGSIGFHITVDIYKDRCASALKNTDRTAMSIDQLPGQFNFPSDYPERFFKELTAERKVAVKDRSTGQILGYKWEPIGTRENHAWDLTVYCQAAIDMMALNVSMLVFKLKYLDWDKFWAHVEANPVYGKVDQTG
jgi:phage terminase large subunit GpA-like protein